MNPTLSTMLDALSSLGGPPSVTNNRHLNFSLDIGTAAAQILSMADIIDFPTLPGYRMPDFKDFGPLAQVANASGETRLQAASDLAAYRADISDAVLRGSVRASAAVAELVSIAIGLMRNAAAAPALAATPIGPIGAAAFVAAQVCQALDAAMAALQSLEKDLGALATKLGASTAAAAARVMPGPGALGEAANAELQRLSASVPSSPRQLVAAALPTAPKPAATVPAPAPPEVTPMSAPPPEPTPAPAQGGSPVGAAAVAAAKSQLGTPYVWGGSSPGGFDCSGLTSWAYSQAGMEIPRVAADQTVGRQVSYEELQPGDLVLWSGHAAVYAGDGMMIEAGDPVQMNPVRTENIGMPFYGFWRPTG